MPYQCNEDLPEILHETLPAHAQDIYRAAINNAWTEYTMRPDREAVAHRVAWAAVKRLYRKVGDHWAPLARSSGEWDGKKG